LLAACGSEDAAPAPLDASVDAGPDAAADAGEPDASAPPPVPRVDGLFDDWSGVPVLAADPAGDGTGAFDVTNLQARSAGTVLYLRFDTGRTLNLNAGDFEDGTLSLELGLPDGHDLTIDLRALDPRLNGGALLWEDIDFESAPTHSASEFEMAMDLGRIGVSAGETVTIGLSGSDAIAEAASFALAEPALEAVRRAAGREVDVDVRVASLNVFESGLLPGSRHDPIVRMLRAVAADVYCLQEEYDLPIPDLEQTFEEISGDGPWHVHKVRDNVIATRHPLVPIDGQHERYAIALVEADEGPLVVVAAHLDCCGWDGNADDELRIDEAEGIVRSLADFRASGDPAAGAPIVVIGDWNLVGSRTPLDIVLDPDGLALEHWLPPQLVGEHVTTWRSSVSYFPPGILDLVVHSPALQRRSGFVLEERRLSAEERTALGLLEEDGLATDHLPVVADFVLP